MSFPERRTKLHIRIRNRGSRLIRNPKRPLRAAREGLSGLPGRIDSYVNADALRTLRGERDARVLRLRTQRHRLGLGVRGCLRHGLCLWVPSRGVAVRTGRSRLVGGRSAPVVAGQDGRGGLQVTPFGPIPLKTSSGPVRMSSRRSIGITAISSSHSPRSGRAVDRSPTRRRGRRPRPL
jgi:hypothetical protein